MAGQGAQTDFKSDLFGEDFSFCWRLHECGIDIWCLPDLVIGHMAEINITAPPGSVADKSILKGLDPEVVRKLRNWPMQSTHGTLFWNTPEGMREQVNFLKKAFRQVKPTHILETGTYNGNFCYFALVMTKSPINIWTFDTDSQSEGVVKYLNNKFQGRGIAGTLMPINFVLGDSKKTLSQMGIPPDGTTFDLAWIDGGHDGDTCRMDLQNCARLGVKNILVDDYKYFVTVMKAVEDFLTKSKGYYKHETSDFKLDNRGIVWLKRRN